MSDLEFDMACADALMAPSVAISNACLSITRQVYETHLQTETMKRKSAEDNAQFWRERALYAERRLSEMEKTA